jgi:hypothetical protein
MRRGKFNEGMVAVFDMQAALERVGNDRRVFFRLLEFFFEDYPDLLGRIHLGLKMRDAKTVELAASSLRRLLGHFDAVEAIRLATRVEAAAAEHDLKTAGDISELLDQEISQLRNVLLPCHDLP